MGLEEKKDFPRERRVCLSCESSGVIVELP